MVSGCLSILAIFSLKDQSSSRCDEEVTWKRRLIRIHKFPYTMRYLSVVSGVNDGQRSELQLEVVGQYFGTSLGAIRRLSSESIKEYTGVGVFVKRKREVMLSSLMTLSRNFPRRLP